LQIISWMNLFGSLYFNLQVDLKMHIVAIHRLIGDKQGLTVELSAALGVTNFEALARLRVPGSGPFVVGIFAEKEQAGELDSKLLSRGFSTLTLSSAEIESEANQQFARRFELGEQALRIETTSAERFMVPYEDVEIIMRGTVIWSSTTMESKNEHKFDLATAVVSGGLKIMKTTKTVREVTREDRKGFINLYSGASPIFAFSENGMVYDALGPSRALSSSANFLQFLAELRKRCSSARYDDRLLNKAGVTALLGPRLNPEEHLYIATALLAKALRKR
jgi:hypothetical protein